MNALHFGAGNIGRGFIGYLLSKSGYHVTFVDPVSTLVQNINCAHHYTVITLGDEEKREQVSGVDAIDLNNQEELKKKVVTADLITLSIGAGHLKSTGKLLQPLLFERFCTNRNQPLDLIACENALYATDLIKESILEGTSGEFRNYLENHVGFSNCAVDRIVPNTSLRKDSPIDVVVEDFFEWDIERHNIRCNGSIQGANYVDHLGPYLERKLFLLNGAHAAIAYLGFQKKYQYVHEAIQDSDIRKTVLAFHSQTAQALCKKHDFRPEDLRKYSETLIKRFENRYLQDELVRVGRNPIRKLSENDRLISPLKLCKQYGIPCDAILSAIAAGFAFRVDEDPEAVKIQETIASNGIVKTVNKITGLVESDPSTLSIVEKYTNLTAAAAK